MHAPNVVPVIAELTEKYSNPPVYKSRAALDLEAAGWRAWYGTMFGQSFVDALAPHHEQALAWHWAARTNLILGIIVQYLAYFSIWSRGHMKTTLARYMIVADAALSIGHGGSYALVVGGTVKKVRGTAATLQTLLALDSVKLYYPELAEVKRNERGGSKGWTADFINTKAGAVFHFIGLDQGVAGANVDNLRPTFIVPDDIDDREDSPTISEARFKVFTTSVLPTRQGNTLVFFAQNLISRFSIMYRIYKQHARVLTYRLNTAPIPAVLDLVTEVKTVDGIVKDIYVSGTPTWKIWDGKRIQEEIESYGLPAFLRECQHEVDESKEGLMLGNYDDDVHVISESEFASVYGSLNAWQSWAKWNFNDWSRTKTDKHANVAGYITISSQNTAFPGATFMFHPMSFVANTEAEDVAERMLSVLSPYAYGTTTWADLRKDELLRLNARRHTATYEEETRFERERLARIIPQYARPLMERFNLKRGVMSHSEDTVRDVFNRVFGFNFHPSNPKKFDAVEEMNLSLKIDFSEAHPFRPEQRGYTRWFIVVPDDRDDPNPRIVNFRDVYRPLPYNDALTPDELMDGDLLRYQLKNWRIRQTVLTVRGESDDAPLKLNDDFGQCVIGDTLVATSKGDTPIRDVKVGDYVWTRIGLKKVIASEMTSPLKQTFKMFLSNGTVLQATDNHPIYLINKGFIPLQMVEKGDILLGIWQTSKQGQGQSESSLAASPFTAIPKPEGNRIAAIINRISPTAAKASTICTSKYGGRLTAIFRKVLTFTTLTETTTTITSRIWKLSPSPNTADFTPTNTNTRRSVSPNSERFSRFLISPDGHRKAENAPAKHRLTRLWNAILTRKPIPETVIIADANTPPNLRPAGFAEITALNAPERALKCLTNLAKLLSKFATNAAKNLKRLAVTKNSARKIVVLKIQPADAQPVFNLEVEDQPEFFANGVLVHNSLQMIYFKRLFQNVELSPEEEFAARVQRDQPHLTAAAIAADPDPGRRSQKYATLLAEQKKFERAKSQNYEKDNAFADMYYAQGLDDDLSWLENL